MKRTLLGLGLLAALAAGNPEARAAQTGVVKSSRLNVRGQPSLYSEVVTQVQQGETITILSETNLANPKTNEPVRWFQIKMPENTPVWVFAEFIDPATKTVSGSRLNLRAGPGENYSVVGRLNQGDAVKDIRILENWMEIETPPTAYGFIAADNVTVTGQIATAPPAGNKYEEPATLEKASAPPAQQAAKPEAAKTEVKETAKSEPARSGQAAQPSQQQTVRRVENDPPPAVAKDTTAAQSSQQTEKITEYPARTAPSQPKPAPAQPAAPQQAAPSAPPVVPAPAPILAAPAATVVPSGVEAVPRRIVRREGLVKSTASIQAPTYFELINPDTRKTIEYLHAEKIGLDLKDYKGKKIIVTGEEGIDPRWPNVPVIEIETLELAP